VKYTVLKQGVVAAILFRIYLTAEKKKEMEFAFKLKNYGITVTAFISA